MENSGALSSRRDMFLDERGAGLRVSWHPERDLVVLSVWQGDSCVGTFRMPVQDVPRLSGLLAAALGDWVGDPGPGWEPGVRPEADSGTTTDPGTTTKPGQEPADAGGEPADQGRESTDQGREAAGGLSVQRRLRLSRPVLKLRGLQHRRRGPA